MDYEMDIEPTGPQVTVREVSSELPPRLLNLLFAMRSIQILLNLI